MYAVGQAMLVVRPSGGLPNKHSCSENYDYSFMM